MALPKTIYFNFKYLKFNQALKLPIFVSHRVWLMETGGQVTISQPIKTAMVRIGFGEVGIFDRHRSRTIWQVNGQVIFNGNANIGHGSKISVAEAGKLTLGDKFTITAESSIVCFKEIQFGCECLLSWDTLIMDTDFHKIKDSNGNIINEPCPILIGDHVWIGCRCLILKGSMIPDNCIVGANSTVSKSIMGTNQIIAGNPCTVLKENVEWEM